jgi:hypothetical protein
VGHPVPGGYKYRDLLLQIGEVSYGTVKYGREFCGDLDLRVTALARPTSICKSKLQTHPLIREGATK